jgi:hypothetical protein
MPVTDQMYIWAMKALNGEISADMRMVTLRIDGLKMKFTFFLTCEPSDFTRERAEIVAVNFDSGLSQRPERLDIEFVISTDFLRQLEPHEVMLFRRWENEHCTTVPDE